MIDGQHIDNIRIRIGAGLGSRTRPAFAINWADMKGARLPPRAGKHHIVRCNGRWYAYRALNRFGNEYAVVYSHTSLVAAGWKVNANIESRKRVKYIGMDL